MAAAGIGSRRTCEELITAGRVQLNGKVVDTLGVKVDPARDRILVDGKPLKPVQTHHYYKLHKPRGVLGDTVSEDGERRTVLDLAPEEAGRLFPVGRLDLHSEGLVLLTDDGELAHLLTHPRYEHTKTYYVLVEALPTTSALIALRQGVDLPEGRTAPAEVEVVQELPAELKLSKGPNEGVWLRIVLREGKKRQIRHMTAAVGYPTLRLVRWAIGPLTLGKVGLGQCVPLTTAEVRALRSAVGLEKARPERKRPPASTRKNAPPATRKTTQRTLRTKPAGATAHSRRTPRKPSRPR